MAGADDQSSRDAWARVHGPTNFDFTDGETHFVAIDAAPGSVGDPVVPGGDTPEGTEGPRQELPGTARLSFGEGAATVRRSEEARVRSG